MGGVRINQAARALGQQGGRARAARLSADKRKAIASMGGRAKSLSHHAERRIRDNFRYLSAVDALGPRPAAVRLMRRFAGPLPSLGPSTSLAGP
jgi:hypothetical protein